MALTIAAAALEQGEAVLIIDCLDSLRFSRLVEILRGRGATVRFYLMPGILKPLHLSCIASDPLICGCQHNRCGYTCMDAAPVSRTWTS